MKNLKSKLIVTLCIIAVIFVACSAPLQDEPIVTDGDNFTVNDTAETTSVTVPTTEPETAPITVSTTEPETAPITVSTTEPETAPVTEHETPPTLSSFSIYFIDVGQADAALVECDGHYMLIDGGNKADSNKIYSVLKQSNVTHLDIVVGTHAHEDHIGGLPGAFNHASADMTLCPVTSYDSDAFADFKKYADKKGGGITVPSVGSTYMLGSASVIVLGMGASADANNSSIVLMIRYGDTSFLFTGDAEREAEQAILNMGVPLSATLLKVGHHGSDTSTTYPFLREIMPQYAVISVGEDNIYGHPDENTLSRLQDAGVTVFRTDMQGDIYCTSDGQTVTVSVSRNADADTFASSSSSTAEKETPAVTEPETTAGNTSGQMYVLNTNTKKFHYPSCSSVKRMSEKNKDYYTGTRGDLIAMGYSPCGNCHP